MVPGLYLDYEETLLKAALLKHVHRNDYRDGLEVRHRRRSKIPRGIPRQEHADLMLGRKTPSTSSTGLPPCRSPNQQEPPHAGWPSLDGSSTMSVPSTGGGSSLGGARTPRHDLQLELQQEFQQGVQGTMDVQLPDFSGTVRCRISTCLDTGGRDVETVRRWISAKCTWKQEPVLGCVGSSEELLGPVSPHRAHQGFAASEAVPLPTRSSAWPERAAPPEKAQRTLAFTGVGSKQSGENDWAFLRHVVPNPQWTVPTSHQSLGKGSVLPECQQVLWSDVAALLWTRCGASLSDEWTKSGTVLVPLADEESDDARAKMTSIAELIGWVPSATSTRWRRMLKISGGDDQAALATKLARILTLKPQCFHIGNPNGISLDEHATVQLLSRSSGTTSIQDGFDLDVNEPERLERSARWLGALPVLRYIPQAIEALEKHWGMVLDAERLQLVEYATERAESLRLCGGVTKILKRLQIHSGPGISRQRDLGGVSSDWLSRAVAEVNDPDHLEIGDAVRLLAHVVAEEKKDPQTQGDTVSAAAQFAGFSRMCGRFVKTGSATAALAEAGAKWIQEAEAEVLHFYTGPNAKVVGPVAEMARTACSPVVLEFVIQKNAASFLGGCSAEDLVGEVLWESCGWDSPEGRRIIRRLQRVFDRYAGGVNCTKLSKFSFVKIYEDGGLQAQPGFAVKTARLAGIYQEVVGDRPMAEFADFVYMMEFVAGEVLRTRHGDPSSLPGVWCMLRDICLQASGSRSTRSTGTSAVTARPRRTVRKQTLSQPGWNTGFRGTDSEKLRRNSSQLGGRGSVVSRSGGSPRMSIS